MHSARRSINGECKLIATILRSSKKKWRFEYYYVVACNLIENLNHQMQSFNVLILSSLHLLSCSCLSVETTAYKSYCSGMLIWIYLLFPSCIGSYMNVTRGFLWKSMVKYCLMLTLFSVLSLNYISWLFQWSANLTSVFCIIIDSFICFSVLVWWSYSDWACLLMPGIEHLWLVLRRLQIRSWR